MINWVKSWFCQHDWELFNVSPEFAFFLGNAKCRKCEKIMYACGAATKKIGPKTE